MANIFLHIGFHKTGTTTLQQHFFPACKGIRFLREKIKDVKRFRWYITRTDPVYFDPTVARNMLSRHFTAHENILLSNEAFSGPPWAGLIEHALDHRSPVVSNLRATFPSAKVILVLRRQDGLARSLYRQYVRSGGTQPMKRFYGFDTSGLPPLVSLDRFRYSPFVETVVQAFPEGVLLLLFEEFQSSPKQFLRKLGAFMEVDLPAIDLPRTNVSSLGPIGMAVSRLLNHFFRSSLNPAGLLPGIPVRISRHVRITSPVAVLHDKWPSRRNVTESGVMSDIPKRIFRSVQQDNRILAERYNLNMSNYCYY